MTARTRTLSEFSAIPQLEALFRQASSRVELGIGDDAAVLKTKGRWVWTVDSAVEHVHFERRWLSLVDLGYRSFQAAASDVCAMGGAPFAALSSVIFPRRFSDAELRELARGQRAAARSLGCAVVGGNLARGAELSITTTVVGSVQRRPLLRSGARVGDELWLCGELGLAAAGLRLLQQRKSHLASRAAQSALRAFRRPRAQLAAGLQLAPVAHAAIDVSDGLAGDAQHIARASNVEVSIDLDALAVALSPALIALAPTLGVSALDLALYGGEDYALVAAGPRRARPAAARVIGAVSKGRGVWLKAGQSRQRARGGFEHSSR
ncbi:MAG TPA: thiamine-phosphate kinase [Polyangiaceae bacterium]|nr:thiamine-phosphate kinase [Polyangiaceae bacterium]